MAEETEAIEDGDDELVTVEADIVVVADPDVAAIDDDEEGEIDLNPVPSR